MAMHDGCLLEGRRGGDSGQNRRLAVPNWNVPREEETMITLLLTILLQVLPSPGPALDAAPPGLMPTTVLQAPQLTTAIQTENNKQAVLKWQYPNSWAFEVRQVSDGRTNISRVRFNGLRVQGRHDFTAKDKLRGRTNVFSIRAWDWGETASSPWSNEITVIP